MRDDIDKVCPVQASSAFLCEIIQSVVPSRCNTENVVVGVLAAINAVIGDVAVIRWYKKGTPKATLVRGFSTDKVD